MIKLGFSTHRDFSSLSVRDLLDAREHYHVHLANKENVVATAIGRFLIRQSDPDAADAKSSAKRDPTVYRANPPRTLANSVIMPWSWPCVLVFVDRWLSPAEFAHRLDQAVPRFLYLPDGRVIPTCVVYSEAASVGPEPIQRFRFPDQLMAGGLPVLSDVQGNQHVGSVGCLVTDGNRIFALTNRHVAGPEGQEAYAIIDRERRILGVSHELRLAKQSVNDVYPGFPSSHASINLDAGLIQLEDVNEWTSQVFGIGEIGPVVDINPETISLDLVGALVRGFGSISGFIEGKIQALFYRYKALGGFDYVTDFLIGSRDPKKPLTTQRGDSGTLWFLEEAPPEKPQTKAKAPEATELPPRPLALQWGGHRFISGEGEAKFQFALASNLSAVCRLLDVEIVRDWNRGLPEYWGQLGHYKIGYLACGLLASPKTKRLFTANADRIGISNDGLLNGGIGDLNKDHFVPLADVPDEIWRSLSERKADDNNHFADMDQEGAGEFQGITLLDICQDEANVNVAVWNRFYASIHEGKRGAVPFRVWQIYNEMVEYVRKRQIDEYICAAGILAHYLGDCGQPLHISQFHHGRPDHPGEKSVHTVYETNMPNLRAADLIANLDQELQGKKADSSIRTGRGAAVALTKMMQKTIKTLPPMDIIDAFNGASGRQRVAHMWDELGPRTVKCIANAALFLATLWESAWVEGNGNATGASAIPNNKLGPRNENTLRKLYMDPDFIKSYTLQQLEAQSILT